MKTLVYNVILILGSLIAPLNSFADSIDYPVVGKPCPNFTLTNVKYFTKSTATNENFKGKWFMLDFWGEYCSGCIKSFPKLNEIQKEFGSDIQVVLIGVPYKQRVNSIEQLYEKHREKLKLNIPIVFENNLADRFFARAYPHIIIVDPQGIVRYITSSVNKEDIKKIINNEKPVLSKVYNAIEDRPYSDFDSKTPLLLYGNGGADTTYYMRSVFTKGADEMPPRHVYITDQIVQLLNLPLDFYYRYAFTGEVFWNLPTDSLYGKIWPLPIFEVKDTSLFSANLKTGENLFAYNAVVSELYRTKFGNQKIDFPGLLKKELETLFPYIANLERREMMCNILYISEENLQKIKSKNKNLDFKWLDGQNSGFIAKGITLQNLVAKLASNPGYPESIPLLYEGKKIAIDLSLKSAYFDDRMKELHRLGFEFRKEKREMDVIVIKDKSDKFQNHHP